MWETTIRWTQDGTFYDRVNPASFSWSTSLLGDGSATLTFKTDDAFLPLPRHPYDLFRPNLLAVDLRWGDFVAFFGKIEDWSYDRDAGLITVRAVELANEFKWRMTYGVANYQDGTLVVQNRTHSGAVARILERFMFWDSGWRYPIDLPADAPGTFSDPGWEYWRKNRISDLIEQVREQGYEIYLRPYVAAGGITRLQTRVAPRVTLATSTFNLQAQRSPLGSVSYTVDGSRQLTGVQALGNGSGQDQETRYAYAFPGEPIPFRDAKIDLADLTGQALQGAANAALTNDRNAIVQWSVGEFNVSDEWTPDHAAVGRVWQIDSYGDPVIPDGRHNLRVIRASGSLGTVIKTEVQSAT